MFFSINYVSVILYLMVCAVRLLPSYMNVNATEKRKEKNEKK